MESLDNRFTSQVDFKCYSFVLECQFHRVNVYFIYLPVNCYLQGQNILVEINDILLGSALYLSTQLSSPVL